LNERFNNRRKGDAKWCVYACSQMIKAIFTGNTDNNCKCICLFA